MNHQVKQITLSIIMPCFNSILYVRDAVDSLLAQSYINWELIAVNDGSTDDTLCILQDYAKNDGRIKVYSKENGGYATAINYGLDRINGDYFLMMGSDDRLAPYLFEEIVNSISDSQPDVIAFRAVKYVDGVKTCIDEITDFDTSVSMYDTTVNAFVEKYPKHSQILFVRDTAKCFKTSLLGDLRYFGKKGYDADGIFSSLFVHKCHSFASIPIDGYLWTLRADSVSASTNFATDIDRLSNWIQYNNQVISNNSFIPTEQERSYLGMAHTLGIKILGNEEYLDSKTMRLIHQGRTASINAALKYSINAFFPRNTIKKTLFIRMPYLWSYLYRLRTSEGRKK